MLALQGAVREHVNAIREIGAEPVEVRLPRDLVGATVHDGNIGSGWVTNIGDYFWGQGSTGPDIPASGRLGQWAISGTV